MIAYIKADLFRIFNRKRFIYTVIVAIVSFVLYYAFASISNNLMGYVDNNALYNSVIEIGKVFGGVLFGSVALSNVYSVDMKVNTMLTQIGRGNSRLSVIVVKQIEVMICVLSDALAFVFATIVYGGINGFSLTGAYVFRMLGVITAILLNAAVYSGFVTIIIYGTRNMALASILFLLLSFGIDQGLIGLLSSVGFSSVITSNIQHYSASQQLTVLYESITARRLMFDNLLMILLYIALGIALGYLVFRKKELDF